MRFGLAWSANLFGPAVKLCNPAIRAPQFHDVSINESLGRCSRTDIVWIVECNFSDEMAVLANETSSVFRHIDPSRAFSVPIESEWKL